MRVPLAWLKDHLDTPATPPEIARTLTALGLEVERIENPADEFQDLVVGEILTLDPHPNADRLQVCSVEAGQGPVSVICGAPNVRVGMKTVFAAPGCVIPQTGKKMKVSVIRGVKSQGMLCSAQEIGLGEDDTGIIELSSLAQNGVPAADVLARGKDCVIEIALTPNRPDCAGIRGIARDLAAAGIGTLKPLSQETGDKGEFPCPVTVHLDFAPGQEQACPEFHLRLIRGVHNLASPAWLRERLLAAGIRPISALVDVTNYLTIDQARPLHVFDAAKLDGDLTVRFAHEGESLKALDGHLYPLATGMTVIADQSRILGLGGIMGGEESGCRPETTDVLLECAHFDPGYTAATGRRLRIESDARYRFERGVDPASLHGGMAAATALILEICGGKASQVYVAGNMPEWQRHIAFRPQKVGSLGGVTLSSATCRTLLDSLGFIISEERETECLPSQNRNTTKDDQGRQKKAVILKEKILTVTPPSWRGDVTCEADLVEEVLRIHGYDEIAPVSMEGGEILPKPARDRRQSRPGRMARALAVRGLAETVNWSFMEQQYAPLFGGGAPSLRLLNPISHHLDQLRPTPLASLVAAAARNLSYGRTDFGLFEIGPGFIEEGKKPHQRLILAGIRVGLALGRHWSGSERAVNAFDAKADLLAALEAIEIPAHKLQSAAIMSDWFHSGHAGSLTLGPKQIIGQFGVLHPHISHVFDIEVPVVAFELFLESLPPPKPRSSRIRSPFVSSAYQPVKRDFAFLVDADTPAADVTMAASSATKQWGAKADIFDIYKGKGVPKGQKSVAFSVTLQPQTAVLTDSEIDAIAGNIIEAVSAATGGVLREETGLKTR